MYTTVSRASPGALIVPGNEPFSQADFLISAAAPAQFPPDAGAEVAFAGRSNAGKSSAINAITQRHGLARTSKTPGRTRLMNFFELAPASAWWICRDTATRAARERAPHLGAADRCTPRARESRRAVPHRGCAPRLHGDEELLAWAAPAQRVHVLLAKADKLSRAEGAARCAGAQPRSRAGRRCSCFRPAGHRDAGRARTCSWRG